MKKWNLSFTLFAMVLVALVACSDDDGPTDSGPNDDAPPGIATITPIDDHHVQVTFNEQVTRSTAENAGNYSLTEAATPLPVAPRTSGAPGDPIAIAGVTLHNDDRIVNISTEASMAGLNVELEVSGVSDVSGNLITEPVVQQFAGSSTPDEAAPVILARAPQPNATNIVIGASVTVRFSEAIQSASHSWSFGGGDVSYTVDIHGSTLTLTPASPLEFSTTYTVSVIGTDYAGNGGTPSEWSFTTVANTDHTPPTLVSTQPANNATNVSVDANLVLTFSEAVNQETFNVVLVPDPGDGIAAWSNGGKTVTFDPAAPLIDDQQYVLTIFPHGVFDLAGNGIEGLHTVTFTTGATLPGGSIAGTISGDPGSVAADPTGATVIAVDGVPFEGEFNILGSATVAGNNTYTVSHLADRAYYLICALDTGNNGNLDPGEGDAFGGYGVNFATSDFDADSVVVAGGAHVTGINFPIFDPSAVAGSVTYSGVYEEGAYYAYVGFFEADGFNPMNPGDPLAFADAYWPEFPQWGMNTLDQSLPDGDYYVGAFLDVIVNGGLDLGEEPLGFYGAGSPQVIHIANGNDLSGVVIPLHDPSIPSRTAITIHWPAPRHNAKFERLVEMVRKATLEQ